MEKLFAAKIKDYQERCYSQGIPVFSDFLNLQEQQEAKQIDSAIQFYGGYPHAERKMALFLPDFLSAFSPSEWKEEIQAISIKGSGYVTLTHRDYLGALLANGLERRVIGDIAVQDKQWAVVFVCRKIVSHLLVSLERIGSDKVTLSQYSLPDEFDAHHNFKEIRGVISSARLDSVVAVLVGTSREKAKDLIKRGIVEVNFELASAFDMEIKEGFFLSIRGEGRFQIQDVTAKTRKDKISLWASHFI